MHQHDLNYNIKPRFPYSPIPTHHQQQPIATESNLNGAAFTRQTVQFLKTTTATTTKQAKSKANTHKQCYNKICKCHIRAMDNLLS